MLFGVALAVLSVLFVFPLIWLFFAALKPNAEVFQMDPIGSEVRWSNYSALFDMAPVLHWTWNSVLVIGAGGDRHGDVQLGPRGLRVRVLPLPRAGTSCSHRLWPA